MPATYDPGADEATLRLATPFDRTAIETMMRASIRDLFPVFYDVRQTSSTMTRPVTDPRPLGQPAGDTAPSISEPIPAD